MFQKRIEMDNPIVIGNSSAEKALFRPGFAYRIGGRTYTVVRDVTKEANTELRELITSDGATEIVSVSTILKDLKEEQAQTLPIDKRYAEAEPKEEVEVPKDEPKKTTKRKTKRKVKQTKKKRTAKKKKRPKRKP